MIRSKAEKPTTGNMKRFQTESKNFSQRVFFQNFDSKNWRDNEYEDKNEKYATDLQIRFPTKTIFQPFGITSPSR